jgi:hypothetical protein
MSSKSTGTSWIHKLLIFFVLINIIGDLGNVVFWWAIPDSRALSLNTGYLGSAVGVEGALIAGSDILIVVAVVYIATLVGLFRKQQWGSLLVIAISIVNRVLAVFLYKISAAFAVWGIWTIILVIFAYLDHRNLATHPTSPNAKQRSRLIPKPFFFSTPHKTMYQEATRNTRAYQKRTD